MKSSTLVVLLQLFWPLQAARILSFYPTPSESYRGVIEPLLRQLGRRGHEIVSVTPRKMTDPPDNYTEILVSDLHADLVAPFKVDAKRDSNSGGDVSLEEGKDLVSNLQGQSTLLLPITMLRISFILQERILKEKNIQKLIHSDLKFDVVLANSAFACEVGAILQHRFGAIGIEILSGGNNLWANELFGNPFNPAYMVDIKTPYSERMSFLQRLHNTYIYLLHSVVGHLYYLPKVESLADKYFNYKGWEGRPSISDLLGQKSLVILNSHIAVDYARPLSPHFVEVGGINVQENTPLPQEIKTFMDEAEDGVILFNLGSLIDVSKVLTPKMLAAFVKSLGKLKQKVIWKWEKDDFPNKPDNIKTLKWLPQQAILAHKNCRIFISHCGFASVVESVYYGVPVIGIPIFTDQKRNVEQVVYAGYGIEVQFNNISEMSLTWAVNEVLYNSKYREAAKLRSSILKDNQQSGMEKALFWIEYVIRHKGAPHLKSTLGSLKWYQSLLIDVIFSIIFAFLIILWFIMRVYRLFYKIFNGKRETIKIE